MSDTRADTTSMGLFLISFIMLVFGIVGIFGYTDIGSVDHIGLIGATAPMMVIVGFLFLFVGRDKYKAGDKFLMTVFMFLGLFAIGFGGIELAFTPAMNWLYYIVVAVFLLVFMLVALLKKAPIMLAIILLSAALVFLFFALVLDAGMFSADAEIYWLLLGVFGFIAFILSLYMALNDAAELNLPVM